VGAAQVGYDTSGCDRSGFTTNGRWNNLVRATTGCVISCFYQKSRNHLLLMRNVRLQLMFIGNFFLLCREEVLLK
jgi:hypothetical protein